MSLICTDKEETTQGSEVLKRVFSNVSSNPSQRLNTDRDTGQSTTVTTVVRKSSERDEPTTLNNTCEATLTDVLNFLKLKDKKTCQTHQRVDVSQHGSQRCGGVFVNQAASSHTHNGFFLETQRCISTLVGWLVCSSPFLVTQ